MEAQMIICDKVTFDVVHKLGSVINTIYVDCFPCIYEVEAFVKLIGIPSTQTTDFAVGVLDSEKEIVASSDIIAVRNYRDDDQVPGIDMDLKMQLLLCKKGIINFKLLLNKNEVTSYPITVRLREKN
ncbi:hypothetical protein [Rossellomorea arthrocnemi]|uniref:hypothetical protein n=1 Tax=Rossellomorea arthrocnemi TaxID=2769542 RepID=UPI00191A3599|nr:hypothetical protein [Rossellomorea arthrocnemi]